MMVNQLNLFGYILDIFCIFPLFWCSPVYQEISSWIYYVGWVAQAQKSLRLKTYQSCWPLPRAELLSLFFRESTGSEKPWRRGIPSPNHQPHGFLKQLLAKHGEWWTSLGTQDPSFCPFLVENPRHRPKAKKIPQWWRLLCSPEPQTTGQSMSYVDPQGSFCCCFGIII